MPLALGQNVAFLVLHGLCKVHMICMYSRHLFFPRRIVFELVGYHRIQSNLEITSFFVSSSKYASVSIWKRETFLASSFAQAHRENVQDELAKRLSIVNQSNPMIIQKTRDKVIHNLKSQSWLCKLKMLLVFLHKKLWIKRKRLAGNSLLN